ncbi:MAG: zinc-ribbon domain-containing protein [Olsenella sp.]|jgi:hypothetical protein
MFCSNCGAKLEPDARFCNSCGAPVVRDAGEKDAGPAQPTAQTAPGATVPISYAPTGAAAPVSRPQAGAQAGAACPGAGAARPQAGGAYQQPAASPEDWAREGDGDDGRRGHRGLTVALVILAVVAALAVAGAALVVAGVVPNPVEAIAGGASGEATTGAAGADAAGSDAPGSGEASAQEGSTAQGDGKSDGSTPDGSTPDASGDAQAGSSSTDDGKAEEAPAVAPDSFEGITTATASSTLGTDGINTYDPENVLDDDPSTCWSEGVNGVGVGESITLSGDGEQLFSGFRIRNGYQKSNAVYINNARPMEIEVQVDGKAVMTVTPSTNSSNKVDTYSLPEPTVGTSITFVIKKAVVGDRYDDTSISEISVF